jgi:ferric-dicitrate binding protein FerR (iron transport regulator)
MNDPKILVLISKHISQEETLEEKNEFNNWLNESKENAIVFEKIKNTWLGIEQKPTPFFKRFTRTYLTKAVVQNTIGNLIGFAVALLVSNSFTHYVTERRSIQNLFGISW